MIFLSFSPKSIQSFMRRPRETSKIVAFFGNSTDKNTLRIKYETYFQVWNKFDKDGVFVSFIVEFKLKKCFV